MLLIVAFGAMDNLKTHDEPGKYRRRILGLTISTLFPIGSKTNAP